MVDLDAMGLTPFGSENSAASYSIDHEVSSGQLSRWRSIVWGGVSWRGVNAPLGLVQRLVGIDFSSDVGARVCGYLDLWKVDGLDDISGAPCFFDHWVCLG